MQHQRCQSYQTAAQQQSFRLCQFDIHNFCFLIGYSSFVYKSFFFSPSVISVLFLPSLRHLTDGGFHVAARAQGFASLSDAELYQAFDAAYDYDVYPYFRDYLEGTITLAQYADRLDAQEWLYPDNYVKLRFLENHDRARAAHILPEETVRRNWTAFNYFQRGLTLVYAGQEVDDPHVPSLFDKDPVHWQTGRDQSDFLTRLAAIKRDPIFAEGSYTLTALPHDVLLAVYEQNGRRVAGLFSLRGASALVRFPAPNGVYHDSITGRPVEIYENQLATDGQPLILEL